MDDSLEENSPIIGFFNSQGDGIKKFILIFIFLFLLYFILF